MEKAMFAPLIANYPKAKPLAAALVEAAAEQGAGAKELEVACELALAAYRKSAEAYRPSVAQVKGEVKAALESF